MTRANALRARFDALTIRDRAELKRLLKAIERRKRSRQPISKLEAQLAKRLVEAEQLIAERRATRLELEFPGELPIALERDRITAALSNHQVVVVCGDTGSGKTTQLPKLCLAAGRGFVGTIAHTQPRRIAARAVAARLAEELDVELGGAVGFKVRFTDRSNPASLIKVMTDGILLNEIRSDPKLEAYDTIIIDEAHERSLNIDFLLGYLQRLLSKRRDLKLIVTSATIDPERFAEHFGGAPIVRVRGRSFPVSIRYRPPDPEQSLAEAVAAAAHELAALDTRDLGGGTARDMLVFLPGERWIHAAAKALDRSGLKDFDILPLYGRLASQRQQRIFAPGRRPRIVLATNIAETSLTVPRIRFVIDSGLARTSRYAARHRVQRLGVEPIARANAEQRAGRCGRLAPGVCLRLYSEADYAARPPFEEPEILRTNLAAVILRHVSLGVGELADFPFLEPPPTKAVNDAYRLLHVLGAMNADRELTDDGKSMARLPVDPRLARLLLSAQRRGALVDALVIAAALSVIDPREYPAESPDKARERHAEFADPRSDFVSLLKLWRRYQRERRRGEKSFRNWCQRSFLSATRLREWDDVRAQLKEIVSSFGWRHTGASVDHQGLHEILLSAFVDFVAERHEQGRYRGMHDARALLFPGSPVAAKRPRWIVAAEHVATEQAYLRTVAQINPRWVIAAAPHMIKREHSDPRWDRRRGKVMAREIVSAFGLVLSAERRVDYGQVDAADARRIFLRDALAADDLGEERAFVVHNRHVRRTLLDWEARLRSRDLFIGEPGLMRFYAARLPPAVRDRRSLKEWCRKSGRARRLRADLDDLSTRSLDQLPTDRYPSTLVIAGQELELVYRYEPGHPADGITLRLPATLLGVLPKERLQWLVPGRLSAKVAALLRTLPKELRRALVPIPDTVAELMPWLEQRFGQQPLLDALREALLHCRRFEVSAAAFRPAALDPSLLLRLEVLDARGECVATSRDLPSLQVELGEPGSKLGQAAAVVAPEWTRAGLGQWDVGALPEAVTVERSGLRLNLYPALLDHSGHVGLELLPPGPAAKLQHCAGVRRLLLKQLPQQLSLIRERILGDASLLLKFHGVGRSEELLDDVLCAAADECFVIDARIRDAADFAACLREGRAEFVPTAQRLIASLGTLLGELRQIRKSLDAKGERLPATARADIEKQLDELFPAKPLSHTPAQWRGDLNRYLQAIAIRLEGLPQRAATDCEFQNMIDAAWQRYAQRRDSRPDGWPEPAQMTNYRWLIEEFRVSLFAQRLGTAQPVSMKRLDEAWQQVLRELEPSC